MEIRPAAKTRDALDVVIVLYRSADVIGACLESLLSQRGAIGRVILVDNGCPGGSVDAAETSLAALGEMLSEVDSVRAETDVFSGVELIRSHRNLGFAAGANLGLSALLRDSESRFYWVLNPDCELTPGCATTLLAAASDAEARGGFSLMGSRVLYPGGDQVVQSDGGVCCTLTGRCRNLHQGRQVPDAARNNDARMNFISGANMIASRRFVERAGLIPEDYFLYYEEVAWAFARQDLPLVICHDAVVTHHVGTAIGSGRQNRMPSPLSNYFNFRSRVRFMVRHHPFALPFCYGFSVLKILQTVSRGGWAPAVAAFRGLFGLSPPAAVRNAFDPAEQTYIFATAPKATRSVTAAKQPRSV